MRKQITRARELRRTATEAERIAWRLLRPLQAARVQVPPPASGWVLGRRLLLSGARLGGGVRRQCAGQPSQARKDRSRDRDLRRIGYTILRLPNGLAFEDPDAFVRKVVERAEALPNFFTGEP